MAAELEAQLTEVIDFSVEHDTPFACGIEHRLVPGG